MFDVVSWAEGLVGRPGPPGLPAAERLAGPVSVDVDVVSRLVAATRDSPALGVEARLRDLGHTLGCYPEEFEEATVGELYATHATGAGQSGPAFSALVRGEDDQGRLLLAFRPRPEVQSGRALLLPSLAYATDALRLLAQAGGPLPEIAIALNGVAARMWLAFAGDGAEDGGRVADDAGVLLLVVADVGSAARERLAAALAAIDGGIDLGQNLARAFVGCRFDVVRHARVLARAGYVLERHAAWRRWRALPPDDGSYVGWRAIEIAGADANGAVLVSRVLQAAPAIS